MTEHILKTRHVARMIGPFWNRRIVLVLQVFDNRDGPRDQYGHTAWIGPFWRDANTSDLTTENV